MQNRAGPEQTSPRPLSSRLDARSRLHVGLILRHVALVVAICLPIAMASEDPMQEYLRLMRAVFGFSALVLTMTATFSRARLSPASLCIWDHAAALLLLKLACALALGIVA